MNIFSLSIQSMFLIIHDILFKLFILCINVHVLHAYIYWFVLVDWALQVTALDLCPQPGTGVLRGDFLTVPIQPVIIDGAALTNGAASTSAEAEISSEIHSSNLKTSHGKQTDANGVLIGTYVEGRDETDSSGSGSGSGSGDSSNGSNGRNEMPSVAVLPEGGFDVVVRLGQ
jgi:hypothetical protein